jgi:septum formation protein
MLLADAQIPFTIVSQDANETECDWSLPLPRLVLDIALYKMDHVILPSGQFENDVCFVLTADTMHHDKVGVIHGKPVDRNDAIAKIKSAREGALLWTGFCIDKKIWRSGAWEIQERITDVVYAYFVVDIPDRLINTYLDKIPFLDVAGAIAIEEYGGQFLKTVNGSYSTIIGLPMFEVRKALEELGFFKMIE